MSERIIADAFDRWLREKGLVFRRDRMDKATTCVRGWPDFEIIEEGRVLLIELKTYKGRLSRDQTNLHKRLGDRGTIVRVCHSIDAACTLVFEWLDGIQANTTAAAIASEYRRLGGKIWRPAPNGAGCDWLEVRPVQPGDERIPLLQ